MPTYDYRCNACGYEFELFQQMSAPVKRKCPECGRQKLERLIGTGAGVLFKGSGFYETDYRSESYKKAAEAERTSSEKAGSNGQPKDGATGAKDAKPQESNSAASSNGHAAPKKRQQQQKTSTRRKSAH
jgi:putative FmdB family regulatory protein